MDNFAILIIVGLIVVALLLLGAGLVVYLMKRGKGSAAAGQATTSGPNQMGAPPFGTPAGPSGVLPEQQGAQGWAPAPPAEQQWSFPESAPAPAPVPDWNAGVEPPRESDPSLYQTQDGGNHPAEQESYVTTPGTSPSPPMPNPELFLTTPSGPRQTSLMDMQAQLQADDGTIISLDRLMMRVGRHPECDIVVPTPGASRQHAEFEFRDGAWTVTDLNSGNGTWVNGVRVKTHQLSPGDEVRIDQTRFRFVAGA